MHTGVAFTPGIDFGRHRARSHVRFAYTVEQAKIEAGIARLADWLRARPDAVDG
jgi:aspartate/methionine/tyrosine aminotransferase